MMSYPGVSSVARRASHNQREQRRARRINDKIAQMKGFLEVRRAGGDAADRARAACLRVPAPLTPRLQFQGCSFKADKYSILDSACVQLQFLFELLVEVGGGAGWADPLSGEPEQAGIGSPCSPSNAPPA